MARIGKTSQKQKIPNPHDRTFRFVFGKPEKALALLRAHLPVRYLKHLDLDTLKVFGTNIVDDNLAETDNDLVFKIKLAEHDFYVFPVLEHQSTQTKWIILRLMIYAGRLMEKVVSRDSHRLPLPLVIVVNQGPKKWSATTSLEDQIDIPPEANALLDFAPKFSYQVIDLPEMDEGDLCEDDPAVSLTLGLMRAVAEKRLLAWLKEHFAEFEKVVDKDDTIIKCWFTYLMNVDSDLEIESLDSLSRQVQSKKLGRQIMTLGEKLEARGEARGRVDLVVEYFSDNFRGSDWEKLIMKLPVADQNELTGAFWKFSDADELLAWISERSRG